jgi:putative acetyltransferase
MGLVVGRHSFAMRSHHTLRGGDLCRGGFPPDTIGTMSDGRCFATAPSIRSDSSGASEAWQIRKDDLSSEPTRDLLRLHLEEMHAHSPPGSVFALDPAGLRAANVTVWTLWIADRLAGIGALKDLGDRRGEVKSMRTHPDFLRRGVAAGLLEHIIEAARARGMVILSLETGSGTYFEPALSLYRRRGFLPGEPFAGYERSAFNQLFHLALTRQQDPG